MNTYSAKRINGPHGWGWYIIRGSHQGRNGTESVLPMYCEDFPESRFEAESIAHQLNQRARINGEAYESDRQRKRVNG